MSSDCPEREVKMLDEAFNRVTWKAYSPSMSRLRSLSANRAA
jgi:hypothetical protein